MTQQGVFITSAVTDTAPLGLTLVVTYGQVVSPCPALNNKSASATILQDHRYLEYFRNIFLATASRVSIFNCSQRLED